MKSCLLTILLVSGAICSAAVPATQPARRMDLHNVRTFMYQIDKLDDPGAIDRLAQTT